MTKKETDKKILTDDDFATDDDMPISEAGGHGITKNEKEEMLKQVLANAGYDYEPKPTKDGDEIWTPCGQETPKNKK
jgi:hypothetical protein